MLAASLKLLAAVLLVSGLGYGGIIAYLHSHQRQLIYLPQYTRTPIVPTNFQYDAGNLKLAGWVVNTGQRDAIIYFGGNGEAVQRRIGDFRRWTPARSTYLVPYRGYGGNAGEPSQKALFADALRLYDVVHARHPDGNIAVIGRSLGTGVASYLASERTVERLVLVTPYDSMVNVAAARYPWLPVTWMLDERYPSTTYLSAVAVPVLIIRAGRDQVVPAASTDRLIAAMPLRPQVQLFPKAGHNDIDMDPGYQRALATFLSEK